MGFISMVFGTMALLYVAIGFLFFVPGTILDIIWIVKGVRKKKVHPVLIVFAVICSIIGFLGFVLPVAGVNVFAGLHKYEEQEKLDKFKKQVEISDVRSIKSFKLDGETYVPVSELKTGFIHDIDIEDLKKCCALVDGEDFRECYYVDNDLDEDIIYVDNYSSLFVPKNKKDEILEYYQNEAPLNIILRNLDDSKEYKIDMDRDALVKLRAYCEQERDAEWAIDQTQYQFCVTGKTKDDLYSVFVYLDIVDGEVVIHSATSKTNKGHHISDEEALMLKTYFEESTGISVD